MSGFCRLTIASLLVGSTLSAGGSMNAVDLGQNGLRFVLPTDPNFNGLLRSMKLDGDPNVAAVMPYSVILLNQDQRRGLCAFSLDWAITQSNGIVQHKQVVNQTPMGFSFPRAVAQEPREARVDAGGMEFISPLFHAGKFGAPPSIPFLSQALMAYTTAKDVTITLDFAAFEDGQVVGPDSLQYAERLQARLYARHDLQVEIHRALDTHHSASEIFTGLAARGPVPKMPYPTDSALDHYKYESARFATELVRAYQAVGEQGALEAAYRAYYKVHPKLFR